MKECFSNILRPHCPRTNLVANLVAILVAILVATLAANKNAFSQDPSATKSVDPPAVAPQTTPAVAPTVPTTTSEQVATPIVPQPRRVHLIVDRKTEAGGFVVYEDENRITIERDGKKQDFKKDDIIDAIQLIDLKQPSMAVLYRRDGSSIQIQLVADDFDEVRYMLGTTVRTMPRSEVYRVGLIRSFEESYEAFKKSIDPKDAVRRLGFCDWLVSEKKYALARTELVALVADTKLPEAVTLLNRVEAQLGLMNAKSSKKKEKIERDPSTEENATTTRSLPTRILTEDEVNLIRVYEIDFNNPPRIIIDPADARTFFDDFGSSPRIPPDAPSRNALVVGDPMKIVRLAFELKARDFYPKIRVVGDPETMSLFRRNVHDLWLIPNCATSRCHGGPDAGKFFLTNENHAEARVRYTNLLNLLMGNSKDIPLVDFTDPNRSILIQYALPREEAATPHPPVTGWRPVFGRKLNQEKLANTLSWIRSMYQPRPVYPIEYQPPDLRTPAPGTPADAGEPTR
jgi:hypothetical protein